ncbi:MAG: pyridoxamine 5'-phosphate oxidase [Alphaproteobacteria bacterium]|nr:pyridoxamine 5'-phosphate oxidase [Alphaproteobacteria bacterium]
MDPKLADMREEYQKGGLSEDDVADDPITQFQRWFEDAVEGGVHEPNGMTLATVDADGQPTARIMLLKGVERDGLTFFTNKSGRKGGHLAANPKAALTFWWGPLQRQVRFEGTIGPVEEDEADAYFKSRPLGSRIGAWSSPQSQVIEDRTVLEEAERKISEKYADGDIPRPPFWGGYRLSPHRVEFWQGRTSRLHDRLCYRRVGDQWVIERLAP